MSFLKTVSRELARYKLDLVGVQEVRWEGGGTEPAAEYIFLGSCLEVEIAIAKLKKYKSPGSDQKETKYYCLRSTNSLILFEIRNNCLVNGRSPLLYQFTKRMIKLTLIVRCHCYQLHTKFY
jgi:hypothetical protein